MSLAHAWSDLLPSRVPRAPRLLFRVHLVQFLIASCAHILLNLGVPDVRTILKTQTYRTKLFDNHLLNKLLNLSCKHAVPRVDVASVEVYNCNVTPIVNFARADQRFVDVPWRVTP